MVKFDVNLSVGRWPFRPLPNETIAQLVPYLKSFGITGGLVRSAEGAFSSDPEAENQQLVERCRNLKGFIPLPVANPFYGYWKTWRNVPAAVLYPKFHNFSLLAQETLTMARRLATQGTRILAVVVREEDERAHHPLCQIPAVSAKELETFAWSLSEMMVIALNTYIWEPLPWNAPNLYNDTAFVEACPALGPLEERIQTGRVLFGSHAPFFCTSAGISKVAALNENIQVALQQATERIFYGKIGN